MLRLLRRFTVDQWRAIDDDTEFSAQPGFDAKILVILIVICVSLTVQQYFGDQDNYAHWFPRVPGDKYFQLKELLWWIAFRVGGFLVVPALTIMAMPGERLRDYYIAPRGFLKKLPIYGVLFLLVLPLVLIASQQPAFRTTYPFYKLANRSMTDLLWWEGAYALQFLALEFCFRGFMLQGLRRKLGSNAVFVMLIPYCMIHFGKPWTETLGAIIAGTILGTLAMRTRSIWGGVLIHCAVAFTMDGMALHHCPPASSHLPCEG